MPKIQILTHKCTKNVTYLLIYLSIDFWNSVMKKSFKITTHTSHQGLSSFPAEIHLCNDPNGFLISRVVKVHEEFWRWSSCFKLWCLQAILVMGQLLHYSSLWVKLCSSKLWVASKRSEQHIIKVWFSPNVAVVKQSSLWILAVTQTWCKLPLAVFQTLLITTKKILSTRNKRPASSTQKLATSTKAFFFCSVIEKTNW